MTEKTELTVRFWGVRGSIPTPDRRYLAFGGNTPCVEIAYGVDHVFIDAGTGIRPLAESLPTNSDARQTLLFTHFHWDHIQGLPFFSPLYLPNSETTLASGRRPDELRRILDGQMLSPYFPTRLPRPPTVQYEQISAAGYAVGAIKIFPFPLQHPDPTCGYRFETPGGIVVHASDHEHGDAVCDAGLREHADGADLLIYDAHYSPEEYEEVRGWGHSTWSEGVRVARDANVRRLALFHHSPRHDDEELKGIVAAARAEFPGAFGAREGPSLRVSDE